MADKLGVTVLIDRPLHTRLRKFVEKNGQKLQHAANEAVTEFLSRREHKTPRHKTASDNGNEA